MKRNKLKISCNGGFTLIELLVVVLIIGILAAVALPQYKVAIKKAQIMRVLPVLRSIMNAQRVYYLNTSTYTNDLAKLDVEVAYESSDTPETPSASWGYFSRYEGVNGGRLLLYEYPALTWKISDEVVIDVGDNMMCYSLSVNSVWEKVCKTLGTYSHTGNGHNYYKLK